MEGIDIMFVNLTQAEQEKETNVFNTLNKLSQENIIQLMKGLLLLEQEKMSE